MQVIFETFNVSGFYASEQAILSLYAIGCMSECTIDIGHGKIGMHILLVTLYALLLCYQSFFLGFTGLEILSVTQE